MSARDDTQSKLGQVYATTRPGKLSVDQMAALMPALGTLMPMIADRFGWMVHAARGGNLRLAGHPLRKVRHLFRVGKTTRPKWTEVIDRYLEDSLEPINEAVGGRVMVPRSGWPYSNRSTPSSVPMSTRSARRRAKIPQVTTPGMVSISVSSDTGSVISRPCTSRIRLP